MGGPKTTVTRCGDGSVQARHIIQTDTTQVAPSLHLSKIFKKHVKKCKGWQHQKSGVGMAVCRQS